MSEPISISELQAKRAAMIGGGRAIAHTEDHDGLVALYDANPALAAIVLAALDFRDAMLVHRDAAHALVEVDGSLAAVRDARSRGIEAQRRLFDACKAVRR